MKNHLLLTAVFAAVFSVSTQAQVQVVDSPVQKASGASAPAANGNLNTNQQAELFYQLQTLQQEVMNLRGLVEEQAFELKRLKQQRLDDYLDLDRRISALTTGTTPETSPAATSFTPSGSAATTAPAVAAGNPESVSSTTSVAAALPSGVSEGASEAEVYGAAYDLLKQRQIDASVAGFKAHLERFPQGEYASNSYYWLGEIYLLKNDLPEAQRWFGDLLAEFPDSRKVPDAQFKLGKVYHLQGQNDRAQELLNIVAASNADASRLAKQYLQENF
ncbi:YbgF trimerization domain-containing protein [Gilvimarinus sp. DA14]|uniref:YbgF trimerization domain-containing protein n=1 Tax=Gilvimarinus sp. DA14 TaxID=2956798 RepID=UPI0020B63A0A|nr:YbgF trimerization domain-containing protein [Gilvimarinus sp. DA14]UTF60377.1 tetratricopeptide repeat protein [Gilvimarinus sp. DA14]